MLDSIYLFKEDRAKYKLTINEWVIYSWFRIKKKTHDVSEVISGIGVSMKKDTMRRVLLGLVSKGALRLQKLSDEEALWAISGYTYTSGCTTCGVDDVLLDKHHFPVRKKNGGTETIDICPNCHRKFHTLSDFGVFAINDISC